MTRRILQLDTLFFESIGDATLCSWSPSVTTVMQD